MSLNELLTAFGIRTEAEVRELLKAPLKEKYPSKNKKHSISIALDPSRIIEKEEKRTFNVGYFFLERLLYGLGMDKICA